MLITLTLFADAAKRRQLPAWIREGLEKMEREKQKKIDQDRRVKEREIYLQKKKEEEEIMLTEMQNNGGQPMIPKKSKFVRFDYFDKYLDKPSRPEV